MAIYVTGDCHANFYKFGTNRFPEQKNLTHDDFMIICGDFGGVWHNNPEERYWLNWLNEKNFTTLYVDGNHENFDRLYSSEFEVVDFCGGKAHKIRENIYHLMRGYVFTICDKKIFAFGGASSHDIQDGILDANDYINKKELMDNYYNRRLSGERLRINHISWWKEEMPSNEEMEFGLKALEENEYKVDYIISHCCPQHIVNIISGGTYEADKLTSYFDKVCDQVTFSKWFFGHYHYDIAVTDKFTALYNHIMRIK